MSNPWLKFYTSDWRADPALRMCSVGARGLWMEMICVMHEAAPYGSLRVNGRPVSEAQVAALAGAPVSEVASYMRELEDAGVFSRDEHGVIVSRRMQRDKAKSDTDKSNGKRGGNPKLKGVVNPPDKVEDKAQKPEARSQKNYAASAGAITERIGELYAALGVTDETKTPGLLAYSEPIQWATAGCDVDADILPALRSIAARGKTPKSWRYCSEAVFEARDRRLAPAPKATARNATAPPGKPRNAGELARQQLEAMRNGNAPSPSDRHHNEGDGIAGFAGTGIARRIALSSGG